MGRDLTLEAFRQILTIAPTYYTHRWINTKLAIDTDCDLISASAANSRKEVFK